MKKVSLLLIFALLLGCTALFASCDQETVNSSRSEIMDAVVDLLGPYLEEASETTGSSGEVVDSIPVDSSTVDSSEPTTDSSYSTADTSDWL